MGVNGSLEFYKDICNSITRRTQSAWLLKPQGLFWPAAARKTVSIRLIVRLRRTIKRKRQSFRPAGGEKTHFAVRPRNSCQ
jgi:hypothetical protein